MQKLGDNARHFILQFPQNSPNSVAIVGEPGDRLQMGVSYEVGTMTNFLTTITQSSMPTLLRWEKILGLVIDRGNPNAPLETFIQALWLEPKFSSLSGH